MSTHAAPPTFVFHSSNRLTHAAAHTILSQFLDTADTNAAYRPDAMLTARGPQSATSASSPNLTLANLRRILAGIEGKRLGGGALKAPRRAAFEDEGSSPRKNGRANGVKRRRVSEVVEVDEHGEPVLEVVRGADGGDVDDGQWQDKDVFELAQDNEVEGDVDGRNPAGSMDDEVSRPPKVTKPKSGAADAAGDGASQKLSKEERKRLKKLRMKDDKKERAKKAKKD